jgi:folate-dependent phosphoribosylglycinamide formyltransferase PurN
MNYLVITGNHPRHLHYLNSINSYCNLVGAVIEERERFIPIPPDNLDLIDYENFVKHFKNREKFELKYFGEIKSLPNCPIKYFKDNLKYESIVYKFINQQKPHVIFIFGALDFIIKIKDKIDQNIILINLNTGLIQRYNGDATLFWPFYFLEPNWAGATFHIVEDNWYKNAIIHQSVPKLKKGDSIHEVTAKVVWQASFDVKIIIDYLENNNNILPTVLKSTGKIFFSEDFRPEHLRVIYNLYNDNIVDLYLNKKISSKEPILIRLDYD